MKLPEQPGNEPNPGNLFSVEHRVAAADRARTNGHRGGILWFTGLSGAGKSTLAVELERLLVRGGCQAYLLDGDNLRQGLNADLGFSPADRAENIRRVGEVAALFASFGTICLAAFISPYRADRERARAAAARHPDTAGYHEVYVRADLLTCERRDPKGLYAKARAGLIPEFTGISAPYEPPEGPELIIDTCAGTVEECAAQLVEYIGSRFRPPGA